MKKPKRRELKLFTIMQINVERRVMSPDQAADALEKLATIGLQMWRDGASRRSIERIEDYDDSEEAA